MIAILALVAGLAAGVACAALGFMAGTLVEQAKPRLLYPEAPQATLCGSGTVTTVSSPTLTAPEPEQLGRLNAITSAVASSVLSRRTVDLPAGTNMIPFSSGRLFCHLDDDEVARIAKAVKP